jgi:putative autotransporter adhesin-like protein
MLRHQFHPLATVLALLALAIGGLGVLLAVEHDVFTTSSGSPTVHGSGVAAFQSRRVAPFTGVELSGSNVVDLRVDGTQSVVVHADDNLLNRVTTTVHDGRLVIGNTPGSFQTKSPMHVEIHARTLDVLYLTGSGVVSAIGIKTPSLAVKLTGSGVLRASGTVTRLDASLTGSGDAQLSDLTARDARALVSGSGRILVTATHSLNASVPGSGAVVYTGNPEHITTSSSGSGAVARG